MRRIAAWMALVGAICLASACVISTSGLSGGVLPTEAGVDATVDASSVVEDAASAEAGVDAGTDADAAVAFCAGLSPAAAFCADFDESADFTTGWSFPVRPAGGGTQTLDGTVFTSGPHSLATALPAGTASNTLSQTIGATLRSNTIGGSPPSRVIVDFDMRYETADQSPIAQIATLFVGNPYEVHIVLKAGAIVLQEDVPPTTQGGAFSYPQTAIAGSITAGTWLHVSLDVNFSLAAITVTVNGTTALIHSMPGAAQSGNLTLEVGAVYYDTGPVAALALNQDNVVVRIE